MAFAQPIDWPYKTHAGSWQALAEELNAHAGFPRQRWWSEYAPLKQPVAGTREAVLAWWAGLEHLRTYYVAAGYDHDIFDSLGAALEAWTPGVKGTRYAPPNKHLKTVIGEFSFWAKGFRPLLPVNGVEVPEHPMGRLTYAYREAVRVVDPRTRQPWTYDYYWEGEQGGLLPDMVRRGLCPGQKAGELWAAFEGRVRARLSGFKESKR